MNYQDAASILNKHIFEGDKINLLRKIANNPERYVGLFRPTKPLAKLIQNLLQSHEIRFGDALESLILAILADHNCDILPNRLDTSSNEYLSIDLYFFHNSRYYFVEQKVRDDHDSTKKRGQVNNFEKKLEILQPIHQPNLIGIMYFIDPDLSKNKNYYQTELKKIQDFYGVELHLFYGREFFDFLGLGHSWDLLLEWLVKWKAQLADFPEINFDTTPYESFRELSALEPRNWRKILENDSLWEERIIQTLFQEGSTLLLILEFYQRKHSEPSRSIARALQKRMREYYDYE